MIFGVASLLRLQQPRDGGIESDEGSNTDARGWGRGPSLHRDPVTSPVSLPTKSEKVWLRCPLAEENGKTFFEKTKCLTPCEEQITLCLRLVCVCQDLVSLSYHVRPSCPFFEFQANNNLGFRRKWIATMISVEWCNDSESLFVSLSIFLSNFLSFFLSLFQPSPQFSSEVLGW